MCIDIHLHKYQQLTKLVKILAKSIYTQISSINPNCLLTCIKMVLKKGLPPPSGGGGGEEAAA